MEQLHALLCAELRALRVEEAHFDKLRRLVEEDFSGKERKSEAGRVMVSADVVRAGEPAV